MPDMPVLAVVGRKNSGKTTLVVGLVRQLVHRGLRVGTIKHGHHDFEVDTPGKDSWRHAQAGAAAVFIVGGRRLALIREANEEPDPRQLVAMCPDMDLFVVEGYKKSDLPKIEIFRSDRDDKAVTVADPALLALVADDLKACRHIRADVPHFHRDQYSEIADFIVSRFIETDEKRWET